MNWNAEILFQEYVYEKKKMKKKRIYMKMYQQASITEPKF